MGLAASMLLGLLRSELVVGDVRVIFCPVSSEFVVIGMVGVFPCFIAVVSSVVRLKRRFPVLWFVSSAVPLVFSVRKFGMGGGGGMFCFGWSSIISFSMSRSSCHSISSCDVWWGSSGMGREDIVGACVI